MRCQRVVAPRRIDAGRLGKTRGSFLRPCNTRPGRHLTDHEEHPAGDQAGDAAAC